MLKMLRKLLEGSAKKMEVGKSCGYFQEDWKLYWTVGQ